MSGDCWVIVKETYEWITDNEEMAAMQRLQQQAQPASSQNLGTSVHQAWSSPATSGHFAVGAGAVCSHETITSPPAQPTQFQANNGTAQFYEISSPSSNLYAETRDSSSAHDLQGGGGKTANRTAMRGGDECEGGDMGTLSGMYLVA